jgi:hypothetical protein
MKVREFRYDALPCQIRSYRISASVPQSQSTAHSSPVGSSTAHAEALPVADKSLLINIHTLCSHFQIVKELLALRNIFYLSGEEIVFFRDSLLDRCEETSQRVDMTLALTALLEVVFDEIEKCSSFVRVVFAQLAEKSFET